MNWGLLTAILSDRDPKFVADMWKEIFKQLKVKSLLSTAYHSQTDESFKITNQTAEIALQYFLATISDINSWLIVLSHMQTALNNSIKYSSTVKTSTEILFSFQIRETLDLLQINRNSTVKTSLREPLKTNTSDTITSMSEYWSSLIDIKDIITFAVIWMKKYYDDRHKSKFFSVENMINLQLHHRYTILSIQNRKIEQQFIDSFRIIKRIEHLIYRLKLPSHWRIHNIIFIAHLEEATMTDLYSHLRPDHSSAMTVNSDLDSYEIEKLLWKRIRHSEQKSCEIITEYLVHWKGYSLKHDVWYNVKNLSNAKNLMKFFDNTHNDA